MIQDIGYFGSLDQPYRWHSVSALRSPRHPENHLEECRTLIRLITKAIDSQCRHRRDTEGALTEIRRLFAVYITLSSYTRQVEMEQVRSLVDERNRAEIPAFISVPYYEDELIRCK
jgi:hypothetical protein